MFFSSMPDGSKRPAAKWKLLLIFLIPLLLIAGFVWYKLFREMPQQFASEEEYFKYGSIGTEEENGIPYWIWLVLPRILPKYLPERGGSYAALGVIWEDGHETPIGFSKKTLGFPRIGINCSLCHSSSYRTDACQPPLFVPGAPVQKFDPQSYQRFLFACASDAKYSADTIMEQISYSVELSFWDKLLYRYVLIPATQKRLLEQKEIFSWMDSRPRWGHHDRIDPFNPVKFNQLGINPDGDSTVGNSDMQSIGNMAKRAGFALHWDGLNTSLTEVVLSSAVADGTTRKSLPVRQLKVLGDYLKLALPTVLSIRRRDRSRSGGAGRDNLSREVC